MHFEVLFMINSSNDKIYLIYEYGRLKVKCSLIDVLSVEGLAIPFNNRHMTFCVKKDIFSSDISGASDDSDKVNSYDSPVSGNSQPEIQIQTLNMANQVILEK